MATKLERDYQAKVLKRIREEVLPGCYTLKNDANYLQGVPDWIILYGRRWGMLEIKRETPVPGTKDFRPNQEWYIADFDKMSFCMWLCPENEEEVLDAIQAALRPRRKTLASKS